MRKKALVLAVLLPLLLIRQQPPAQAANKDHITKQCSFTVSADQKNKGSLADDNFRSIWTGGAGSTVRIESTQAIGGLYIRWQEIPKQWEVRSLKGEEPLSLYTGPETTFFHQYVPIESAGETALELHLISGGSIADVFVLAAGAPVPDWVQQWKPMWDKADLLLISTHADDELLWFGGALPVYAGEFQKKVQVAYLTNHGPRRTHELLNGLWTVGVTAYPMISDFPDLYCKTFKSALAEYDEKEVLGYQVKLLRRFKPDVVLGQDINGEYGHGVHILNTYTLRKALEISSDPAAYPELAEQYGLWQVKKCYLHLYDQNRLVMDWSQPLSHFGGKTGLEMAKKGFACHVSQQKPQWKVEDFGKNDCRQFGLYYTTVGQDRVGNDFFENVNPCIPWKALPVETKPNTSQPPATQPSATQPPTTQPVPTTTEAVATTTVETAVPTTTTSAQQVIVSVPQPDQGPGLGLLLAPGILLVAAGGSAAAVLIWRRRTQGKYIDR